MATHSSALAWRLQWTEEPGELQSMGSTECTTDRAPTCIDVNEAVLSECSGVVWVFFCDPIISIFIYTQAMRQVKPAKYK